MDIPDEIHKKLVCVARRGRFSHIIAPRIWQAPDGRVLQILDNQSSPLDETFYNALVEFEKAELAKESVEDVEEVKQRQDLHLSTSDEVVEVIDDFGRNVATATTSSLAKAEYIAPVKSEQQATATGPRTSKVHGQSILAYMTSNKKAKSSSSSSMLSERDPSITLGNGDKEGKTENVVGSSDSSATSLAIRQSAKKELESNTGEMKKVEMVFTLRDCLIHQWDARIRARCHVLQPNTPKNAKPASVASTATGIMSNLEVIVWFRMGCVRIENNLAFAQSLWLASKKFAKVHAIAFASEQHSQIIENVTSSSYRAALSSVQAVLKREFDISLTVFDADESAATSLLALWTRMRPVLGVFTAESYNATSMRVTQATSRAVQCPTFNFDSENPMPLRYLQASAKDVSLSSLEAFKSHVNKHHSLPKLSDIVTEFKKVRGMNANHRKNNVEQDQRQKTDSSSSTPSTDSVHSSPDEQQSDSSKLPDIVEKRWRVWKPSLDDLSNIWSEKCALELASKLDTTDEQLVSHFRVGTLSPFSIAESRSELFFVHSWKSYRNFVEGTKSTL